MRNYFCYIKDNESKVEILIWTLSDVEKVLKSDVVGKPHSLYNNAHYYY